MHGPAPTRAPRRRRAALALVLAAISGTASSCDAQSVRASGALDAYDFTAGARTMVQLRLPAALREISGLAVTPDGRVFAHGDEEGIVYEIDHRGGTIVKAFSLGAVPARDDFEGIAIVDARFFLVTGKGRLYEAREGANGAAVPFTVRETGLGAACEIEGLAYEPADRSLIIPCKRPYGRALRNSVTLFHWSIDRGAAATPDRIAVALGDVVRGTRLKDFSPSSVDRDPSTGHYIVVAGPQGAVVEVTARGTIAAARVLPPRAHRQPEGVAFLRDASLLVADEGGNGRATLTVYRPDAP